MVDIEYGINMKPWRFADALGRGIMAIPIPEEMHKPLMNKIMCADYKGKVKSLPLDQCPKHSPHVIGIAATDPIASSSAEEPMVWIHFIDNEMQNELKCKNLPSCLNR